MGITTMTDPVGGSVWAFRSGDDRKIALVWFKGNGVIMYVLHPFEGTGSWVTIENPKYDHAETEQEFHLKALEFFSESDA